MDQLAERGYAVRHNLERPRSAGWARIAGAAMKRGLEGAGGYGGDFATVLSSLRLLNRADVVFSTVDTVGIPLMLLGQGRVVRSPFVYTAIGLPERLVRLRSARMERLYARALGSASAIVVYSEHEADVLTQWLRERGAEAPVEFVPFGVDVEAFRPTGASPDVDIVLIGADPHRDFELLLEVARALPETSFVVVTTGDRARTLGGRPSNVSVETDLPFDEMRRRLERARASRSPCATTAIRERPQSSFRRWPSQSRSSSHGRPRSRRATGSGTETMCGSSRRESATPSVPRSRSCSGTRGGHGSLEPVPARLWRPSSPGIATRRGSTRLC